MPPSSIRSTALLASLSLALPSCTEPECGSDEIKVADMCFERAKKDAGTECEGGACDEAGIDGGGGRGERDARSAPPRDASVGAPDSSDESSDSDIDATSEPGPSESPPTAADGSSTIIDATDVVTGEARDAAGVKDNCPPQACDPGSIA